MQLMTPAVACALFLLSAPGFAQVTPPATVDSAPALTPLTLNEALAQAALANPTLRAKQAELAAAEGARTDANRFLFNNPQISLDKIQRQVPQTGRGDARVNEWGAGLSQAFETGGQGRLPLLPPSMRCAMKLPILSDRFAPLSPDCFTGC